MNNADFLQLNFKQKKSVQHFQLFHRGAPEIVCYRFTPQNTVNSEIFALLLFREFSISELLVST